MVDIKDEEQVEEKVTPEPIPETPKTEVRQHIDSADLSIGYAVGITPDGKFIFQLLGTNKGIIELMGIHDYATRRVNAAVSAKQITGDALVHEVGKAVALINQKLDKLVDILMKSPNSL